jgi:transcriptional regulator with XRE-family HTH domain
MTTKERTIRFITSKGLSVKKFEEICGLSNGYINSMKSGFGNNKLSQVLTAFPELNRDWLVYGEGDMLKLEAPQSSKGDNTIQVTGTNVDMRNINQSKAAYDESKRIIKELESRIEELLEDKKRLQDMITKLLEKI